MSALAAFGRSRLRRYGAVTLLLGAMAALAWDAARRESVTIDEPLNLTAGYLAWREGDYRLQESSGILPQRWFALPLLVSRPRLPERDDPARLQPGELGLRLTNRFFFGLGNDVGRMVRDGRLMAVAGLLLAGLAIYGFASRLFGAGAGLLALAVSAFDPTLLAHGHLMTSDVPAALLFLVSAETFARLLARFTPLRLALSAGSFGLLLATKMSGGLFIPAAVLMAAWRIAAGSAWPVGGWGRGARRVRSRGAQAGLACLAGLVHGVAALVLIWCLYGGQRLPSPHWDAARDGFSEPEARLIAGLGGAGRALATVARAPLLPEAYVYGLAHTLRHAAERHAYLNGAYGTRGWWYYFPYCFAVKTPLPALGLMALGAAALLRNARGRRARLRIWIGRTAPLWSLAGVYGAASLLADLNIGQRHLLPLYLPLYVLAGAAAWWVSRSTIRLGAAVLLLVAAQAAVAAAVRPHFLSYFNFLAGGPSRGYLRLTDSNVDWGQDLPALADWAAKHPDAASPGRFYLSWFGYDLPSRWGIAAMPLPDLATLPEDFSAENPLTLGPGTFCFSATYLVLPGPPWDAERERAYRAQLADFTRRERSDPIRPGDPDSVARWRAFLGLLAQRQYDRLRAGLMRRPPDGEIGHSILIFRLSERELRGALLPAS